MVKQLIQGRNCEVRGGLNYQPRGHSRRKNDAPNHSVALSALALLLCIRALCTIAGKDFISLDIILLLISCNLKCLKRKNKKFYCCPFRYLCIK